MFKSACFFRTAPDFVLPPLEAFTAAAPSWSTFTTEGAVDGVHVVGSYPPNTETPVPNDGLSVYDPAAT